MTLPSPPDRKQQALRGVLLFGLLSFCHASVCRAANLDLVATADLAFGKMVATGSAGTVTISPNGLRSASGGVILGNGFGASAASFTVTGDANASYSITLPSLAQLTSGTDAINVDGFTLAPAGGGTLGPGGSAAIQLGATLHGKAAQRAAAYAGTFVVIVSYN